MKKIILTMMACAGLCACTNEEIVGPSGTTAADELSGAVAYLTVNIKDVGSSTRASDGGFAYGTADEQKVANAYFYFYDDYGNYMARGSVASVSGTASSESPVTNIEWESNTVVAVYGLENVSSLPTRMVTVLNQPSEFYGSHLSLDEMQAALAQATYGYLDADKGNFVMSTSTYSSSGVVNYTALTANNFSLEPINVGTDYPSGGVDVYVERLAAKVSVTNSIIGAVDGIYDLPAAVKDEFDDNSEPDYVGVKLLGWDINGTSRDSYMLKNIADNSNWSGFTFVWNDATDYRCYWAESPNYGVETTYPTSSNGNDDAAEATAGTWLNDYLKYTSLNSPIAIGSNGYCAENTNTAAVLGANTSTGITNVLVKAQVVDEIGTGLDLVNYHGMYYTADGFCNKCVDDVVEYDFTVLVDSAIVALQVEYPTLSSYLELLKEAVIHDHIYCTSANEANPTSVTAFDGSMLSLYNAYDGNVKIFFNDAQPYWGENGDGTAVEPDLYNSYKESDIVYGGKKLGDYNFWFHVDNTVLGTVPTLGLEMSGLLLQIGNEYYMPLNNRISFTTQRGHVYTMRNYLLRAITEEADGINTDFGSIYPIFYNKGMMYYSIPIEHLAPIGTTFAEGQYGVVRNHWYNITLNNISDLGRGIADDTEVIVPQIEPTYYYLGADVNILSWKVVNQTADLK